MATIPDLPHLFIVPGSLVAQVHREHQVFFKRHSIDILIYSGTGKQRAEFWSKGGPYHLSKHKPRHRVIIASHSVRAALNVYLACSLNVEN